MRSNRIRITLKMKHLQKSVSAFFVVLLNRKNEGALAGSFTSYEQKHIEKNTGNTRKIFIQKWNCIPDLYKRLYERYKFSPTITKIS